MQGSRLFTPLIVSPRKNTELVITGLVISAKTACPGESPVLSDLPAGKSHSVARGLAPAENPQRKTLKEVSRNKGQTVRELGRVE